MKKRAISEQAKDQKRDAILSAALDEFYCKGFKAARMDDIAKAVGMSKGALYLYFSSKEDMFVALIQSVAVPKITLIEQGLGQAKSVQQGVSQLLATAPYLIRQSQLPKVLKVLISDAFAFPDVVEHYRENIIARALKAMTALLEQGQINGEIQIDNPALTARLVVAPIIFSVVWTVVFENQQQQTHLNVEALLAEHQQLLFKGLGITKGEHPCN